MIKIFYRVIFCSILAFFALHSAFAAESKQEQAKVFVQSFGNQIIATASEKIPEVKRKEKIVDLIDGVIDSEWIANFTLGKTRKLLNESQLAEFKKLYRSFMINTYGPKFKNYNGKEFVVMNVQEQNKFFIVKANFIPKDSNTPISIALRLKERGDKMVVVDFVAEGVSLIETQRAEFTSVITQKGPEEFLKLLAEKVQKLKA